MNKADYSQEARIISYFDRIASVLAYIIACMRGKSKIGFGSVNLFKKSVLENGKL